jgi:hypothetical protein
MQEFTMSGINPTVECPKFDHCSAPICPIDPEWRLRVHIQGDPICFYLREHSKHGHEGRNRYTIEDKLLKEVVRVYPEALSLYDPLKKRLEKISKRPSRKRKL